MSNTSNFFKDVWAEMQRVHWPTRQETVKYTLIVAGMSIVLAAFLGGLGIIFSFVLNRLITH